MRPALLDQFFAGKFHNHSTVIHRRDKAVMLAGSDAGHWLKPVGKMGALLSTAQFFMALATEFATV